MRCVIFSGTTEGRRLSLELARLGWAVAVCVATGYGREEQGEIPGVAVLAGRMDEEEMARTLRGADLCVDATHPYANIATTTIRATCEGVGTPLLRLLRPASLTEGVIAVTSCRAAAEFLTDRPGNILLATGAKELSAFGELDRERLYIRILPTHEGLSACEDLDIPHSHILALQGPFSQKLNEAILEQYQIAWLVTKDGGRAGGFEEKLSAAQAVGVQTVLVERPSDQGENLDEILARIKELIE